MQMISADRQRVLSARAAQLPALLLAFDKDKNGKLDFAEFIEMAFVLKEQHGHDIVENIFGRLSNQLRCIFLLISVIFNRKC